MSKTTAEQRDELRVFCVSEDTGFPEHPDDAYLEKLANDVLDDLEAAEARTGELEAIIERERSAVSVGITSVIEAIRRREWLRLGRGSYEYDDDRWRDEFSSAIDEVVAALGPLKAIAADWSDCPTDPNAIKAARALAP